MRHIHKHSLRVADAGQSAEFYQQKLGMTVVSRYQQDGRDCYLLGYPRDTDQEPPTLLELQSDAGFQRNADAPMGYWKIAISVVDVDLARQRLLDKGVSVTPARQVPDVAYLCHLADPDGHCIELIQHRFADNHQPVVPDPAFALGSAAVFSLITYRVKDPQPSLAFYQQLGMRLLSRQDVEFAGFTLYFLGYTDDVLPDPDICAVGNREWLWQRPYTQIELQHNWGTEQQDFAYDCSVVSSGFAGIELVTDEADLTAKADQQDESGDYCLDPDGYRIDIRQICLE